MRYLHCPRCGAATVLRAFEGRDRDHCLACDRTWFDVAKPCATALVEDDAGRVLLLRRACEPFRGYWNLPGGFLEADEHPEAGAVRETMEESGLAIALTALHGVYLDGFGGAADPTRAHHSLSVAYRARVASGAFAPTPESSEAGWFAAHDLPPDDAIAYGSHRAMLADWRRARQAGG